MEQKGFQRSVAITCIVLPHLPLSINEMSEQMTKDHFITASTGSGGATECARNINLFHKQNGRHAASAGLVKYSQLT